MTPTFNSLPVVHCPEWAPKTVQAECNAVCDARQGVETKRAEVLAALEAARNQDLAVFTPVQFNPCPLWQQELLFRRAYSGYLRNVMAAASAYRDKCNAEAERAREEVKGKLLKMGYLDAAQGVARGTYTSDMIARHPLVRTAVETADNASGFNLNPHIAENQQQINELTARLSAIREAVIA